MSNADSLTIERPGVLMRYALRFVAFLEQARAHPRAILTPAALLVCSGVPGHLGWPPVAKNAVYASLIAWTGIDDSSGLVIRVAIGVVAVVAWLFGVKVRRSIRLAAYLLVLSCCALVGFALWDAGQEPGAGVWLGVGLTWSFVALIKAE